MCLATKSIKMTGDFQRLKGLAGTLLLKCKENLVPRKTWDNNFNSFPWTCSLYKWFAYNYMPMTEKHKEVQSSLGIRHSTLNLQLLKIWPILQIEAISTLLEHTSFSSGLSQGSPGKDHLSLQSLKTVLWTGDIPKEWAKWSTEWR